MMIAPPTAAARRPSGTGPASPLISDRIEQIVDRFSDIFSISSILARG